MKYAVEMASRPKFHEDRFRRSTVIGEGGHIHRERNSEVIS
jgi:hypothetical protein